MFTGLVEATGRVRRRSEGASGFRLGLACGFGLLPLGASVCVNGACLTVAAADGDGFEADVSVETDERTTLGALRVGDEVNLERALLAGDRLGGHLVTGHVDGVATVVEVAHAGESLQATIAPPAATLPFIAEKGSVALDGVSLTVNRVFGTEFEIMLVPHTLGVTTLGVKSLLAGRRLNLEVDLVARYVVRYLEVARVPAGKDLEATLRKAGFIPS